ncbi:DUF2691 family protein [Sporosarcina luteola]|uniref:DUF2691 family protein n=1 Tax=Sporosarcina luteola TaxID=582850 RepID=UPI00203E1303|nr:DUF2691 family protein [Sporosarcina luteola]MCM3636381.1 DUF2691 family protein [Sporosarcina luteola]
MVFQIRNEHGKQLYEILEGISESSWYWSIVPEESYYSSSNNLNDFRSSLFSESETIMDGKSFMKHISKEDYYLIFADIKAFPTLESVVTISNEMDFMKGSCKLGLLVVDSVQVIIYSREKQILLDISERAESLGYRDIRFLNNKDTISAVWGWMDVVIESDHWWSNNKEHSNE